MAFSQVEILGSALAVLGAAGSVAAAVAKGFAGRANQSRSRQAPVEQRARSMRPGEPLASAAGNAEASIDVERESAAGTLNTVQQTSEYPSQAFIEPREPLDVVSQKGEMLFLPALKIPRIAADHKAFRTWRLAEEANITRDESNRDVLL